MRRGVIGIAVAALSAMLLIAAASPASADSTQYVPVNTWYPLNTGVTGNWCTYSVMVGNIYGQGFAKFADQGPRCNDLVVSAKVRNPVFGDIWLNPCSKGNARTTNNCSMSADGSEVQSSAPGSILEATIVACITTASGKACGTVHIKPY